MRVVTARESAAWDAATIAGGTPSRALMERAGAAAAGEIALRYRDDLRKGALVLAGPGNNGGDGWVVARALAAVGHTVRVVSPAGTRSADAVAERQACGSVLRDDGGSGRLEYCGEGIVVDALLGTGATGPPAGAIAPALSVLTAAREHGAIVVALDVPTGLDATTGVAHGAVAAHLTITFGGLKPAHLVGRTLCGRVIVVDIGLSGEPVAGHAVPNAVGERWVAGVVPPFAAEIHKGVRGKLVIVGGDRGMAGAAILAARAALRSGIGMVRLLVHPESLEAVQRAEPAALAATWSTSGDALKRDVLEWADALVVGPGLGRSTDAEQLLRTLLARWRGPVLVDADALNAFAGRLRELSALIGGTGALLTPHPVEMARLVGTTVEEVLARRFEVGSEVAREGDFAVLLKGVPTVISGSNGVRLVSAAGTPTLATGGAGDVLSGIGGTMLAQIPDAATAGAAAAWVHGRAAEIASPTSGIIRGAVLNDVLDALREVWDLDATPLRYPVLFELGPVGGA
ncbi:MAG TPA: NAD(P)H-hydrate dehydratase [Gemmatimonadaceae bacterium]|nr:NAD(P)H-hydrate dehydratase [Gemmatimonadaceae bacterium]